MEVNEEYVQTLLDMGFPSDMDIRRALRLGKNDLSEAVAILTDDNHPTGFDTLPELDVEMKETQTSVSHEASSNPAAAGTVAIPLGGPPPSYDEASGSAIPMATTATSPPEHKTVDEAGDAGTLQPMENESLEFPLPNLIELENRVFTESWSIPYKEEESLGKCLVAAIHLAHEKLCESDENCKRFLEKCMPEAFQKLLTSNAVLRWAADIQEGIYDMLQMLVDLVAARLQYGDVPIIMLQVLTLAFNPETEYHTKNRLHRTEVFGAGPVYAGSPPASAYKDPCGWLCDLINRSEIDVFSISSNNHRVLLSSNYDVNFAEKKGFDLIQERLEGDGLTTASMAALLAPLGVCAEYLKENVVEPMLCAGMEKGVKYVQGLDENELKEKKAGCVYDLLVSMKLLCLHLWPEDVKLIDVLRLVIALKMLKLPHFNAKMNALKQVTKLIEDSSNTKMARTAISGEKIAAWLVDNEVLSIALEGNIDQVQYCDKVKNITDFLGMKLSKEELTKIWKMQHDETGVVVENIHAIIAAAAIKFNSQQLENLFILIQKSWQEENDRMREKLLGLIGKIGRDARIPKTTSSVLELLWDLAHLPVLPTQLVEQAMDEHLAILNNSFTVKEHVKKSYVMKCVDDIKEGRWVLPALKQLEHIIKNIAKTCSYKAEKGILQELNKNSDIIKQVTASLIKFHQVAVSGIKDGMITPEALVDSRYSHKDYITVHLSFLQFVLQEGVLYLSWHRARDIWDILVVGNASSEWDKQTCFKWFMKGTADLEQDTQSQLFQKEILRLQPQQLSEEGFTCFKCYFENVNQFEHRLKKSGGIFTVEKPELIGMDFLWGICLNTPNSHIAEMGVDLLMSMSYSYLSPRLKKDALNLHKKFIDECYSRLEAAMIPLGASALSQVLSAATAIVTSICVSGHAILPSPSRSSNLLNIERLLLIAERYVVTVEELYTVPRTIQAHGASFQGPQITLNIASDSPKLEFEIQAHSNESVGSIRHKVAQKLKLSPDAVQIVANDKLLNKDQKLLHQLDFDDHQKLTVRATSSISSVTAVFTGQDVSTASATKNFNLEQEKNLPGVVMSSGGHVYKMLYQLADLDEPRITSQARSLLKLVPTDPSVLDNLSALSQKPGRQPVPGDTSPRPTAKFSPRKFIPGPTPTPTLGANLKEQAKNILKSMFDASAPDMSTFRVLYNLEVLSSQLMPSIYDSSSQHSACMFCDDFVSADGVSLVVNVLQRDSIPVEVNYSTRQGCYTIAIQLLRLLLCGQDITGQTRLTIDQRRASTGSVGAAVGSGSRPPSLEVDPAVASRAIQMMRVADFTDMITCFMRVSWAAAAGKLNLASATPPIRDCNSMTGSWQSNCSTRSRQSSTGSTASSGSETENQSLHAGVCVRQSKVTAKDANIAKEALELLVTCLQLRSHMLSSFYSLPFVADFIIDVLVGSPHPEIRDVALKQFYCLSQTAVSPGESAGNQQSPHHFMLQILLKARLPFWVSSSNTRGSSYRLLKQCTQYFKLRCRLLKHLAADDQRHLQLNVVSMLSDEIDWLRNFVTSQNEHVHETDNLLLAGHLTLLNTLLTCDGVDKTLSGKQLVHDLLHDFIFPASKLIMDDSGKDVERSLVSPKCSTSDCRIAAYDLLLELADGCLENLTAICKELISMHHQVHPESVKQWEHMPPVTGRSAADFVGLKNGGATCYMNSVLQQLFMTPGVVESVLAVNDEQIEEDSVFCQVQQVFGHLLESQLQFYEPEVFWKVFRLWGQTVNIRDQQDALDFYQAIIDQMDEQLKKIGKELIFKKKFQGVFSDQKICKDCLHRYEREEIFFALNVTVKNATLQDSLDQFVKGELLEGDNAYFCEKCGQKRNAIKRMCIKTLPPHLCIQLKRFDYDWESNRAIKFDDHFKFPWVLDMEPYTAEGMARREDEKTKTKTDDNDSVDNGLVINTCSASNQINYELAGVVVHSGQANAGHYYSFIKDRRGSYMSNPNKGKWYKFNDTFVEGFEMTDTTIEAECFGGRYEVKVYDQSSSFPEERLRYWNAYLLFYEKVEEERGPLSAKKSKVVMWRNPHEKSSMKRNSDSLVELTELVHKGEKRGLFPDRMPAHIQQVVRDKNLRFMKNRDVYDPNYFTFVRKLVNKNTACATEPTYEAMSCESLQLAIKFLLNTYFHTSSRLRDEMEEWQVCVGSLVTRCKAACLWLVDFLSSEEGAANFKPMLLECPSKDIRTAFANILEKTISCFFMHGGVATHKNFSELVENLLRLLSKDVSDNYHNCSQYFHVLNSYVQLGTKACSHMNGRKGFQRLVDFLLGPAPVSDSTDQSVTRKWSSLQAREFGCLHNTLAVLILNCDVSPFRTDNQENLNVRLPQTVTPQIYLKMSAQMQTFVFGSESKRYIREVVLALREVSSGLDNVQDMLLCCSFCNSDFTMAVLKNIMYQYVSAPSNELKGVFSALMELLLLEDVLKLKRLKCVIDGHVDTDDTHYEGLLAVIRSNHLNDSRRSYQSVKFLVTLANKCPVAKDYLLQSSTKWQWAVNWLKTKMSDDWMPQPSSTASNEDSNSKSFQRTMSAQVTLDEANALLKELETHSDIEAMDTWSGGDTDHNDDMSTDSPKVEPSKDALDEIDK